MCMNIHEVMFEIIRGVSVAYKLQSEPLSTEVDFDNISLPKLHSCPLHDASNLTAVLDTVLFPSSKTLCL